MEAAGGVNTAAEIAGALLEDEVPTKSEFHRLMLDLDVALTGNDPRRIHGQYRHYPYSVEKWLEEPGGDPIWYLSDSGYSRVCWHPYDRTLNLTYNSTPSVVARWEAAKPQRDALLAFLTSEYVRLGGETAPVAESLTESRGPSLKVLKDNRVELDDAERKKVMRAGAVWHPGNKDKPVPGVWKSVVRGKTWYVCNTHRAFQCKSTIGAAIRAFRFIETTA